MNIEIIRYRLPIYWIGALINGDYTGISNEEAQEVDDFVKHADGCPVGVDWGTEGFYSYEVESRAMLLIDLLDKKVLTLSDLNLN